MVAQKQLLTDWDNYIKNVMRETEVPFKESEGDKARRIKSLLGNFKAFCKYYFPNFTTADFAEFHLEFANKVIDNSTIYAVIAWSREHSKSVVSGLFLPLFLKFNKELFNMILVSNSYDKAEELLMPIMVALEFNQRIINDFGLQRGYGHWESRKITTRDGCSFRALGAGQSPRGLRQDEKRPDFILVDDIDIDEEGRNDNRVKNKWEWLEQALYPAMSVSGPKRFIVAGNIIHKNSIVVRASKMADYFRQVNILDKKGRPAWKERYSMEQINYMLSKISYASAQKEYFNNPISTGTVFKDMRYGKIPPLSKFRFLVCYTDPSFKESKKSDFKATGLLGLYEGNYYIIKAFVEQTSTAAMIDWHYQIRDFVGDKNTVYYFIEANMLQDIFLEEFKKIALTKGYIPIQPDIRKKADKFSRIEATLEPLHRTGRLILNEDEKKNPHMMRLAEQFEAIEPSLPAHDDAPDMVEGGIYIINTKMQFLGPIKVIGKKQSSKKY